MRAPVYPPRCLKRSTYRPNRRWSWNVIEGRGDGREKLALVLVSLLRQELHNKGMDLSMRRVFELLGDIREMLMLSPPQGRGGEATVRTSITALSPEQRSLYDALALERYASR